MTKFKNVPAKIVSRRKSDDPAMARLAGSLEKISVAKAAEGPTKAVKFNV